MISIPLRSWRISEAIPFGLHAWFDPRDEVLELFRRDSDGGGDGVDISEEGSIFSASASEAEARAAKGNEQLDLNDLTKSSSSGILDHG